MILDKINSLEDRLSILEGSKKEGLGFEDVTGTATSERNTASALIEEAKMSIGNYQLTPEHRDSIARLIARKEIEWNMSESYSESDYKYWVKVYEHLQG